MMRRGLRLTGMSVLMPLLVVSCNFGSYYDPPLPQFLRNLSGEAVGAWTGCPSNGTDQPPTLIPYSAELNARLGSMFPAGTPDRLLVEQLKHDRFRMFESCPHDDSIRQASFFERGKGFLPYDVEAKVFWKRDRSGRIVWVKGSIFYSGL